MPKSKSHPPKLTASAIKKEFENEAASTLRALKFSSGYTYAQIAQILDDRDLGAETESQLKAKLNRGKFSFAFFIKMLEAFDMVQMLLIENRQLDLPRPRRGLRFNVQIREVRPQSRRSLPE